MKFNVGDKIKIVKPFLRISRNHLGSVGIVTEHRFYGGRYSRNEPTHYVVKFDCYLLELRLKEASEYVAKETAKMMSEQYKYES